MVIGYLVNRGLGEYRICWGPKVSGQFGFKWLIDLGRLFMLILKRPCENERLLFRPINGGSWFEPSSFLGIVENAVCVNRHTFIALVICILSPPESVISTYYIGQILWMDAEPTQLYSQELVYPLAENPIHFIHSEKKLPIKVLKLFLLISSKKRGEAKMYSPESLHSKNFWRGSFLCSSVMCWSDTP